MACKQGFSPRGVWRPFSSHAYAANAVFVPEWGRPPAVEFMLSMVQNYPLYKTHPLMDIFHRYTKGPERFDDNHEFRVLGWEIDAGFKRWSFLYLPTDSDDVKLEALFVPVEDGNMLLFIDMHNPSNVLREWEFHLYISPCRGIELAKYKQNSSDARHIDFFMEDKRFRISSKELSIVSSEEVNSDFWINFPCNAETSSDPDNPLSREKRRLMVKFSPVVIPPCDKVSAVIDFSTGSLPVVCEPRSFRDIAPTDCDDVAFKHLWWETLHNQQYSKSFNKGCMTNRIIPARQWGRFFIWDAGMTCVGALEEDEKTAEEMISEMPDPREIGPKAFEYGSFIPTALFALWELFVKNGDRSLLAKDYDMMKSLVLAMYFNGYPEPARKSDGMVRPYKNRTGVDDYPSLVYADGWPFAWDYKETLPLNPSREPQQIISVGMTALALRLLKIMRLIAWVMDYKNDTAYYSGLIDLSEKVLNSDYWDEGLECFADRLDHEAKLLDIHGVYEYLPLFSGSVSLCRQETLLAKLTDGTKYWTPFGITVVARDDPNYREQGYWNGGVWIPPQWFFWKAFYNIGRVDLAQKLADAVLKLWETNHEKTLCCWEKFCVKNGSPAGNSRFAGLSTPLLALYRARRSKGRVQASQELVLDTRYDIEKDIFEIDAIAPFYKGPCGMSAVAGKPGGMYKVQIDNDEKQIMADEFGYISFSFDVPENCRISIKIL